MLEQLRALIWLRLVIAVRAMSSGKAMSYVIVSIFFTLMMAASLAVAAGLYWAGANLAAQGAHTVLFVADACMVVFLFLAFSFLVGEIQRSEIIDLRKMLFLPVSLRMVFALNFFVSLFSVQLIIFVIPALGFVLGLASGFGERMYLALALAAAFYLMLNAWIYYVQGWLAALMENKRRRRLILGVLMITMMMAGQLPNLLNVMGLEHIIPAFKPANVLRDPQVLQMFELINLAIPVGWLPYGTFTLADNRLAPALGCMAGMLIVAAVGLALGYRRTYQYYMGTTKRSDKAAPKPVQAEKKDSSFIHVQLPFVDDDVSAMTAASILGLLRQPLVFMLTIFPLAMGIVIFARHPQGLSQVIPFSLAALAYVGMSQLMMSVFGAESGGFRALMLLPTQRKKYLLAKNIALFPFVCGYSLILFIGASVLCGLSLPFFVTGLIVVVQTYLSLCIAGNFLSVYFPLRLQTFGQRRKVKAAKALQAGFLPLLAGAITLLPSAFCLAVDPALRSMFHYKGFNVGPPVSVLVLILTVVLYCLSLNATGRALQRREELVLNELVRDTE